MASAAAAKDWDGRQWRQPLPEKKTRERMLGVGERIATQSVHSTKNVFFFPAPNAHVVARGGALCATLNEVNMTKNTCRYMGEATYGHACTNVPALF